MSSIVITPASPPLGAVAKPALDAALEPLLTEWGLPAVTAGVLRDRPALRGHLTDRAGRADGVRALALDPQRRDQIVTALEVAGAIGPPAVMAGRRYRGPLWRQPRIATPGGVG